MPPVFWRHQLRTVRQTAGRYVAIVVIGALGCGFFAGLRMTGVGMRRSADAFFDRTNLYDLELVSTLGFSSSQVGDVSSVGCGRLRAGPLRGRHGPHGRRKPCLPGRVAGLLGLGRLLGRSHERS